MDIFERDGGATTADTVHKREEFRQIVADVQELPETQRTALLLREIDALSYDQIAEAMDTTVPSVKSLLVRARVSLAEAAEARLLTCDEVRLELGQVAEGLARTTAPVRRHLKGCDRCRTFKGELRKTTRALAAVYPIGPLIFLKKLWLAKARRRRRRRGRSRRHGRRRGRQRDRRRRGDRGRRHHRRRRSLGRRSTLASKAAAGMAAAVIVTAGAVEVKHVSERQVAPHRPAGGRGTGAQAPAPAPPVVRPAGRRVSAASRGRGRSRPPEPAAAEPAPSAARAGAAGRAARRRRPRRSRRRARP